jgi:hypothetical protein
MMGRSGGSGAIRGDQGGQGTSRMIRED